MMYDIIVFLNSVTETGSRCFQKSSLWGPFWGPKSPVTCGQKAIKRRKNLRFQKYPDTCGWALSLCVFFFRCAFCQVDDIFTEYESRIFGHQGMKGVDDNK